MSLSNPAPRRHLHTRRIECRGYEREDGLFDIEASILDEKTYALEEPFRGLRPAGAPVHDMALRLTLDRTMTVKAIEVTTNHAPYDICPSVAPAYQGLVGAKVGAGWRKAVAEAAGRTRGCTHISELLLPAATVAFQTMGRWKPEKGKEDAGQPPRPQKTDRPAFIDGCKAWASDGPVVRRMYPMHYKGPA